MNYIDGLQGSYNENRQRGNFGSPYIRIRCLLATFVKILMRYLSRYLIEKKVEAYVKLFDSGLYNLSGHLYLYWALNTGLFIN